MSLRLVIWNCAMALHSKVEPLMSLKPDIAIIPECATPEIVKKKRTIFEYSDAAWIGQNQQKGLGVFTFSDFSLKVAPSYDSSYELFLPLLISGQYQFNLLALWAFNNRTKKATLKNDALTRAAIQYYRVFIMEGSTIVAGDFNHNVIWDKPGQKGNFCHIAADLRKYGLVSAYHVNGNHRFGEEPDPTLIWRKDLHRAYHIDYCFVPNARLYSVKEVSVGTPEKWVKYSDHVPLVIEIETEKKC